MIVAQIREGAPEYIVKIEPKKVGGEGWGRLDRKNKREFDDGAALVDATDQLYM